MSEEQAGGWRIYGDAMQVVGEALILGVIAGLVCVGVALLFDTALVWALAPLAGVLVFAIRVRARGAEVQDRLQKGQQV